MLCYWYLVTFTLSYIIFSWFSIELFDFFLHKATVKFHHGKKILKIWVLKP